MQAKRLTLGHLSSFGGIFVIEDKFRAPGLKVEQIVTKFRIPPDTEISRSPGKEYWIYSNYPK